MEKYSSNKNTQQKLAEILQIKEEIDRLQQRLEELLNPEKQLVLPASFSLIDEVLLVVREHEAGVGTQQIVNILRKKYPQYGIDRKKVASALAYLKNKKKAVRIVGRSTYALNKDDKTDDSLPVNKEDG